MMIWLRWGDTLRGRGGIRLDRIWFARSLCVLAWWNGGLKHAEKNKESALAR